MVIMKIYTEKQFEREFHKVALLVQDEWKMGGLASTMYEDYARECCKKMLHLLKTEEAGDDNM